MKAEVETIGKHERSVKVEIPVSKVEAEIDHVVRDIRKSAKIQGFRQGKAPESVILKMYKDYIDSHAKEHLVGESLPDILKKESLIPVSEPVIDAPPVARGTPFTYTARFEVRPTVLAKGYAGLALKKEDESIKEETVDERLQQLRETQAQYRGLPEDHAADLGDSLVCVYRGTIGERRVGSEEGKDFYLDLGNKGNLPGLDEKLKGIKAGEERQVAFSLPKDLENEEVAGKEVNLHFEVKSLRRRELPALDDELAKDLGEESLKALQEKIRKDLQERAKQEARQRLGAQAAKQLLEKNPLDVPPAMVEHQMHQMFHATQQRLAMQGMQLNLSQGEADELQESLRTQATESIQRAMLLESIAEQEKLEVPEEKVEEQLREMALSARQPYEKVRAVYEERGLLDQMRSQLRLDAALDFVLEKAKIS